MNYVRFVNSRFTSNTYILYKDTSVDIWLVDPGDMASVWTWMKDNDKISVKGILLTHTHFDHLYGANDILERFPKCPIYVVNEEAKQALFDAKRNSSLYAGFPVEINNDACIQYYQNEILLWDDVNMSVFFTPGHSDDSVCLLAEKNLFTGDTLIYNLKTVTKLRGGNVEKLKGTINFFKTLDGLNFHICPGHNEEFELDGYDLDIAVRISK